jgi:hypothetical protein
MPKNFSMFLCIIITLIFQFSSGYSADRYQNFKAAVYVRAYEVQKMKDLDWLKERFEIIKSYIKIDKIYLETHRDMITVDEQTITRAKDFFEKQGIKTSGGVTLTVNEPNRFQTFCYTNPEHRKRVVKVIEYTARLFDELILDDFFFTNCKCESCIRAKGNKSWTRFRLEMLDKAARELVIKPAKRVNPDIILIIKYPNWYEHYQAMGYNLETEPELFDKIYTGTETRDPVRTQQHLQQYQSYLIFRYLENIKSGGNAGGWVDTGGMFYLDRYAEQLWLTLFAKAPEIMLFDFRQLLRPILESYRAQWQGQGSSFDFDQMIAPVQDSDGVWPEETPLALAAGYALQQVDSILDKLGNPLGIKSYKPYHSIGEDFLHNYLGMVGIPIEPVPEFPEDADMIFLTQSASYDKSIVDKIKNRLIKGKAVVITSGLLKALQGKGIEDIVELEYTGRKSIIKDFVIGRGERAQAKEEIMIPQIQYMTNDSWEEVSSLDAGIGWSVFHKASYGNSALYIVSIPDNFGDLYNVPAEVWTRIKEILMNNLYVRVESPTQVALFVYDNNTFIVESFLPESADIQIVIDKNRKQLQDVQSGELLSGTLHETVQRWGEPRRDDKMVFQTKIKAHSYRVFRCE